MSVYVGTVLHGSLGGAFGRDHYGELRIEAVGTDWIVGRDRMGRVQFGQFDSEEQMESQVKEWRVEPPEEPT